MNFPREGVCSVWLQGLELSDQVIRDILSVFITFREGKAADGSMTLSDTEFKYFDSRVFSKNREIGFIMGFSDDAAPFGPFVIKSIAVDAPDSGAPTLTVEFQDQTHRLNKSKGKERYTGNCQNVFEKIAEKHPNLGYKIQTPKNVSFDEEKALVRANKTKAALINSLAERYGFVWGVDGNVMYFRRPISLDELGEQKFVPVLSYRINDCSIMNFSAKFKFTREKLRQGAKAKVENIDFENCEDTGAFLEEVITGKLDVPQSVLESLGFEFPPGVNLDEDTANGKTELNDKQKELVEEINRVLASDKTRASELIRIAQDNPFDTIGAMADSLGLNKDTSATESTELRDSSEEVSFYDSMTNMFKDSVSAIKGLASSLLGDEDTEEQGLKNFSGTASPDSLADVEAKKKAVAYQSVVVCEASVLPTISSPRYKPSMGIVLCGLGTRLSGKYRVTEVSLRYDHDGVFVSEVMCQKRFYGATDSDKRLIAAATKQYEETGTAPSNPGGADKEVGKDEKDVRAYYDVMTNRFSEGLPREAVEEN